jgi:2-polyprenyl-3-methyl-5-hydroxy-6-metoxy-1,4-benzoquinol methylase
MNMVKRALLKTLIYFRLYPNVFLYRMPFKIYQFNELKRGIKFSRDEVILDIGCGGGLQSILLGRKCKKVIGIDTSERAIRAAQLLQMRYGRKSANAEFYCVRLENAEFKNECFDKIFSIRVLEHIPNYIGVLREVY